MKASPASGYPQRRWWMAGGAAIFIWGLGYWMGGRRLPDWAQGHGEPLASQQAAASADGSDHPNAPQLHSVHDPATTGEPLESEADFVLASQKAFTIKDPILRKYELMGIALALDPTDLPAAMTQAANLQGEAQEYLAWALIKRWTTIDPTAAAAFAFSREPKRDDHPLLTAVAEAWGLLDPEAALAYFKTISRHKDDADSLQRAVFYSLAEVDPARAFALSKKSPDPTDDFGTFTNMILGRWTLENPQAAAEAALTLPPGRPRIEALIDMAASWARKNPTDALAWAQRLPDADVRRAATRRVIESWVDTKPAEALPQVLALPTSENRSRLLDRIVSTAADADPQAALALLAQFPEENRDDAQESIVYRMAASNPEEAHQYVLGLPAGRAHDSVVKSLISGWLSVDPPGAAAFALHLPPGRGRDDALKSMVRTWSEDDPRTAANWIMKNMAPDRSGSYLEDVVNRWSTKDPTEALAWVNSLTSAPGNAGLLSNALQGMSIVDVEGAARLAQLLPPKDAAKNIGAYKVIASNWAQSDPAAAAEWALTIPLEAREQVYSDLVSAWARISPRETAIWLGRLPAGNLRDEAVSQFSVTAYSTDPEGALAWAASIGNAEQRQTQTSALAHIWLEEDASAAKQWLARTPTLSAAEKQMLLRDTK